MRMYQQTALGKSIVLLKSAATNNMDAFWKNLCKDVKPGKEMKQFFKECAAWLEGYIEAFKGAHIHNSVINPMKAELESIKSLSSR